MAKTSPTQRTLARLREEGYYPAVVELPLTQGFITIIDKTDLHLVSGNKWVANEVGSRYYAVRNRRIRDKNKKEYLHRVLMGNPRGRVVDHINGDCLDNRRENLRICTKKQNFYNQKGRNSLGGFKGVTKHRKKFIARLMSNYKNLYLGLFETPEEAARAYNKKAIELWGKYARLNNV